MASTSDRSSKRSAAPKKTAGDKRSGASKSSAATRTGKPAESTNTALPNKSDESSSRRSKQLALPNLSEACFYHGNLTRVDAEMLVLHDGDFLVRATQKGDGTTAYTITIRGSRAIIHYTLTLTKQKKLRCGNYVFANMEQLNKCHFDKQRPLRGVKLLRPVPRDGDDCTNDDDGDQSDTTTETTTSQAESSESSEHSAETTEEDLPRTTSLIHKTRNEMNDLTQLPTIDINRKPFCKGKKAWAIISVSDKYLQKNHPELKGNNWTVGDLGLHHRKDRDEVKARLEIHGKGAQTELVSIADAMKILSEKHLNEARAAAEQEMTAMKNDAKKRQNPSDKQYFVRRTGRRVAGNESQAMSSDAHQFGKSDSVHQSTAASGKRRANTTSHRRQTN